MTLPAAQIALSKLVRRSAVLMQAPQSAQTSLKQRLLSLVVLAQLRFLWRARGSMVSALLGMAIGVASIAGVHLLSAQIADQVRRQAEPLGGVDLYLQRDALGDEDYFALRETWRRGAHPAVAALFPLLDGVVEFSGQTLLLTGTDPLAVKFSAPVAETEGSDGGAGSAGMEAYLSRNSVYLPSSFKELAAVGELITLGDAQVQVLGHSAPEGVVLADLPTARVVLKRQGLSRIGVQLTRAALVADGWPRLQHVVDRLFPGALPARAAPLLGSLEQTAEGRNWSQVPAANASPTVQLLQSVLFNVAALSMLALVVAWLLTYQVACHALGRRQAMFARLQSLGVAKSRLRRLTLIEGVVLGFLATVLGVLLGVWLANLLYSLVLDQPFALVLSLDQFVLLKALASGVGVAGLSYALAARDELFDNSAGTTQLPRRVEGVAGWLWLAGLVLVFLLGLLVPATGLPGAFACIFCCALVLIVFLPRLAGWAWRLTLAVEGGPLAGLVAPLKLLGRRQVLVSQELRLGISALSLALATALGISVMVDSFRGAFVDMLDRRLADDAVLVLRDPATAGVRAELEQATVGAVTGVLWRGVVPVENRGVSGRLEFSEDVYELLLRFVAPQAIAQLSVATQERPQSIAATPVVYVNESYARLHSLQAGEVVSIQGRAGVAQVTVGGIFTDYGEVRPRFLGSADLAGQLHGEWPLTEAYVRASSLSELRVRLASWLEDGRLQVRDQGQVRAQSLQVFEQTFAITRALTWLALLVAVVALANALAAHALQLAGTDRQLQVLGVSADAARRLRLSRTFYAAGIALLLAVPLGFAIAALLCGVVNPRAFGWGFAMQVTFPGVGWPLLGGILGGVLAGLLGLLLSRRQSANVTVALVSVLLIGCGEAPLDGPASASDLASPALRVGTVLGGDAVGFARATVVREFEFPQDHGAHPQFRSEWWYLTCPLRARDDEATEYGVQFTLFRQGLAPLVGESETVAAGGWRSNQIYMAHAALTSVADAQHWEASRFARGHPRLAGARAEPFAVWLENWRLEQALAPAPVASPQAFDLNVATETFSIALQLQAQKPLVLQGDRGLSYKGSREASYYYSLPRLAVTGQVILESGDKQSVTGACWFDREWSTSVLAEGLAGWDWFALQFDDQTEMMLFQLRSADGESAAAETQKVADPSFARRQGKAVARDGRATQLGAKQLHFEALRYWRDETGIDWPVEWRVTVAGRALRVQAALDDQRMRETLAYWEGLVWVYDGAERVGQGYLEMTGYSAPR